MNPFVSRLTSHVSRLTSHVLAFILLMINCLPNTLHAQCGNYGSNFVPNTATPPVSAIWVDVYFHIVRKTDQTGALPPSEICKAMTDVNKIYNKYGIFFNKVGTDFIDNDNLYTFHVSDCTALFSPQTTKPNTMNIYVVDKIFRLDNSDAGGWARDIRSTDLCITKSGISNTLTTLSTNWDIVLVCIIHTEGQTKIPLSL